MKKFLISLFAATSIFTPGVALAENEPEDHLKLWNTLQNIGVTTVYNHKLHCVPGGDVSGIYYYNAGYLVVCQDNMSHHLKEEKWTDNDFDTLRHEAHHVLQDCVYGTLADGEIGLFFEGDEHYTFVGRSSMSEYEIGMLYDDLQSAGLDYDQIKQEIEAYVVARDIPASMIERKLKELCSK